MPNTETYNDQIVRLFLLAAAVSIGGISIPALKKRQAKSTATSNAALSAPKLSRTTT